MQTLFKKKVEGFKATGIETVQAIIMTKLDKNCTRTMDKNKHKVCLVDLALWQPVKMKITASRLYSELTSFAKCD